MRYSTTTCSILLIAPTTWGGESAVLFVGGIAVGEEADAGLMASFLGNIKGSLHVGVTKLCVGFGCQEQLDTVYTHRELHTEV